MNNVKEITVTIPAYLYEASIRMMDLGLFRDLSDLIGAGLRHELREAQQLLKIESENWATSVANLRAQIQQKQAGQSSLSDEELLAKLRAARQEIWEHDYRPYYSFDT